jgi:hypothetical protein
MPSSTNLGAYTDCVEIFDRAVASRQGIRIPVSTPGDGRLMVLRLQQARSLVREKSKEIYPDPTNPNWGTSPYDPLIVRMPRKIEDRWWVYIEPRLANTDDIEELGDEAAE